MKTLEEVRMDELNVANLEARENDFLSAGVSACEGPRNRFVLITPSCSEGWFSVGNAKKPKLVNQGVYRVEQVE
mgnify:CR=1 FL=1